MKKGLTEIIVILDRSGSMTPVISEVRGAFNAFVDGQKAQPGEARLSLVLFDDQYQSLYYHKDIQKVEPLGQEYTARGWTALFDAVGRTITEAGQRFANMPESERPERVLCVIHTDGQENHSKEYEQQDVKRMIEHQRDLYSWEFVFMGADQDAWSQGAGLGIAAGQTLSYDNKTQNAAAFDQLSHTASLYRSTGSAVFDTTDLREKEADKGNP